MRRLPAYFAFGSAPRRLLCGSAVGLVLKLLREGLTSFVARSAASQTRFHQLVERTQWYPSRVPHLSPTAGHPSACHRMNLMQFTDASNPILRWTDVAGIADDEYEVTGGDHALRRRDPDVDLHDRPPGKGDIDLPEVHGVCGEAVTAVLPDSGLGFGQG